MRLVADARTTYAMCDTDSLFIAATETGQPDPLAPDIPVMRLADIEDRIIRPFEQLNPYNGEIVRGSILEIKPVNYDTAASELRTVRCYAIASKRYCLHNLDNDGRPHICVSGDGKHRSEHGLGHVLPPLDHDSDVDWISEAWEYLVGRDLGIDMPELSFFDQPTFGRITITSPHDDHLFRTYNETLPYHQQIRPFGFALVAHRHRHPRSGQPDDGMLIAAYTNELNTALNSDFIRRGAPEHGTTRIHTHHYEFVIPGSTPVQSFRDLITDYSQHPEIKSNGADGNPCSTATRGILQPSHIVVSRQARLSKETHRLADGEPLTRAYERVHEYAPARTCKGCDKTLSGRQRDWCGDTCRKRAGRSTTTRQT
jgi:hypothetical protein